MFIYQAKFYKPSYSYCVVECKIACKMMDMEMEEIVYIRFISIFLRIDGFALYRHTRMYGLCGVHMNIQNAIHNIAKIVRTYNNEYVNSKRLFFLVSPRQMAHHFDFMA